MSEKLPFEPDGKVGRLPEMDASVVSQEYANLMGHVFTEPTSALVEVYPTVDSRVLKLLEEAEALKVEALALVVDGGPAVTVATNNLVMIKGLQTALEILRKSYAVPLTAHTKHVNDSFRDFTDPLGIAFKVTEGKVIAYHQEEDRIRQKQIDLNRQREELAQKEMEVEGELSRSLNLQPIDAPVNTHHVTDMGSTTSRTTWTYEVENIGDVPAEYLMIDASKVGRVVRAGTRNIPGIRIVPKDGLAVSGPRV